jgi:hypothetical protein
VTTPAKRLVTDPARRKIAAIAALLAVLLGGGIWGGTAVYSNYFATETVNLTVKSMAWERQLEVEIQKTFTQTSWWPYPDDARNVRSRQAVRSYRQVLDHYETRTRTVYDRVRTGSHSETYPCGSETRNMGNGRFETSTKYCTRQVDDYSSVPRTETYQEPVFRSEPVYDTEYTFEVDRWVTDHWEKAFGRYDPHYPEVKLDNPKLRIGDERRETYDVVLVDAQGREFDRNLDQSTWSKVKEGDILTGEQTKRGALRKVNWPIG